MKMAFAIRSEHPEDIEQVQAILRSAFPTDAESRLVDALRTNGKATISLVALKDQDVLGHILFSPVSTSPSSEAKGLGLAPVAVHSDFRSMGIGGALISAGLYLCRESGYDYCVVLGAPEYYGRFGFEKASEFGVQNEYGVNEEFMMIRFNERVAPKGLIKYADEFARFSV